MATLDDLFRERGVLFDSGAHHVGGHLYVAAVEHVQQPRQAFLESVLVPFGGGDVRVFGIYLRQRALGSALGLSAGFHLHGDGDDQASAIGPERIGIVGLHSSSLSGLCGKVGQRRGGERKGSACHQEFTAFDHAASTRRSWGSLSSPPLFLPRHIPHKEKRKRGGRTLKKKNPFAHRRWGCAAIRTRLAPKTQKKRKAGNQKNKKNTNPEKCLSEKRFFLFFLSPLHPLPRKPVNR